jgi:RNA polymerase sigma-70 factor (ECF subfamily)
MAAASVTIRESFRFPFMASPPRASIVLTAAFPALAAAPSLEAEVVGLFDELRDGLLRYVLSFGLPVPDGEEIVQEVFLLLFRHLRRGKPRSNLRGWVFRVAHNLALKQRTAGRRTASGVAEGSVLDPSPNPEDQLASSQRRERLQAVLRALPEQDRRCIHLRAEGLRYREIAEVLGMSLGAVSLSLGRSLARFGRADEQCR